VALRERFHRIMRYQPVDRLPYIATINLTLYQETRWVDQGMPAGCNPYVYFGFDEGDNNRATMWLNRGRGIQYLEPDPYALPRFEPRPERVEGDFVYIYDIRHGSIHKRLLPRKKGDFRVRVIVDHFVKTREDWLEYKKRFDPHDPRRYPRLHATPHFQPPFPPDYPETWEQVAEDTQTATHLVKIDIPTGFGGNGMAFEDYLYLLVDDPAWVREMSDYFGWFYRELARRAVETARIDYFSCEGPPRGLHGDLVVSPKMYFDYTEEDYRKNFAMARANGIGFVELPDVRHLVCEGKLIRLATDAGLTPILQADGEGDFTVAGRRKQYGKQFPIWGGMDLREFTGGKSAIDEMVARVFSEASEGGYLPFVQDRFGSGYDVPFEFFRYFTEVFRRANGM